MARRDTHPTWLQDLIASDAPIEWFDEAEAAEVAEEFDELTAGGGSNFVPLGEMARVLSEHMYERLTPVGRCAVSAPRPNVVEAHVTLFIERDDPSHLLAAVHPDIPPFFWFPAGQTPEAFAEAIAPYQVETAPEVLSLPHHARGFIGTEGVIEMGRDELVSHISMNPLAESLFWGSAHASDPWPADIGTDNVADFVQGADAYLAQRKGAVWSMSFRSIASRAVVTIEDHDGIFVADVRYEDAGHDELIGALNEQFQMCWPAGFPVDVAALFVGFHFEDIARLSEMIDRGPWDQRVPSLTQEDLLNLYALSAVLHGDHDMLPYLLHWMNHTSPEVRLTVADVAVRRGHDFLLAMMAAREDVESDLYTQLTERL